VPTWFEADQAGTAVLVTSGTAIPMSSVFMPATNVVYQNLVGPQEQFEALMRTVFLPILMQFIGGGGDNDDDDDEG
jgi:hypothetical protein